MISADDRKQLLLAGVAAEKKVQLDRARAILKPIISLASVIVFALCFWRYNLGVVLSVAAAVLTFLILPAGFGIPVGYILGQRAARRFKASIGDYAYFRQPERRKVTKIALKHFLGVLGTLLAFWGVGSIYNAIVDPHHLWLQGVFGAVLLAACAVIFIAWSRFR